MKMWKQYCVGLVLSASLTPSLPAQDVAAPVAGAPVAAPAAAPPKTIWSFLGISKDQLQACKEKLCKKPIGQLLNNASKPMSVFTGGLLGNCCPPFNKEDLLKPPDSAEGAAARIKADEAAAKQRRAAVRYLGTVDCHYWPEAQDALIAALRGDRNECVRWEAAMALGSGCCCTKATVKALSIAASSSEEDGNPSETSDRVKGAAYAALQHCLACLAEALHIPLEETPPPEQVQPEPVPAPRPEPPAIPPGEKAPGALHKPTNPAEFYKRVEEQMTAVQVFEEARRAALKAQESIKAAKPSDPEVTASNEIKERSVFGLLKTAFAPPTSSEKSAATSTKPDAEHRTAAAPEKPAPALPLAPTSKAGPDSLPSLPLAVPVKPPTELPAVAPPVSSQAPVAPVQPVAATPAQRAAPVAPPASSQAPAAPVQPTAAGSAQPAAPVAGAVVAQVQKVATAATTSLAPVAQAIPPAGQTPARNSAATPAPLTMTSTPLPWAWPPPAPETNSNSQPVAAPTPILVGVSAANIPQLLSVLRGSLYPEQREWAATQLSGVNWRSHPQVVQGLAKAAREDSAPTVRVACLRSLAQMNASTAPVLNTVQALKHDADPRVNSEANKALAKLSADVPDLVDPALRPASAIVP